MALSPCPSIRHHAKLISPAPLINLLPILRILELTPTCFDPGVNAILVDFSCLNGDIDIVTARLLAPDTPAANS